MTHPFPTRPPSDRGSDQDQRGHGHTASGPTQEHAGAVRCVRVSRSDHVTLDVAPDVIVQLPDRRVPLFRVALDGLEHDAVEVAAQVAGELPRRGGPKGRDGGIHAARRQRSEEHTSELQSLMRISYAVFCLKKKTQSNTGSTQ